MPIINILVLAACIYMGLKYWLGLKIHEENRRTIYDPFLNMKFDPEMCHAMRKDFHMFNI
jgi:hypothetical protein